MRSTIGAMGVLSLQVIVILFCAICALAIAFGPIALLGYIWISGTDDPSPPMPLWLPIFFLFSWVLLVKILPMSMGNLRNFSWQETGKIVALLATFIVVLTHSFSQLP